MPPRLIYRTHWLAAEGTTLAGVLVGLTLISTLTFMAARLTGVAYVHIANVTEPRAARDLHAILRRWRGDVSPRQHPPRLPGGAALLLMLIALPLGMYAQSFRLERGVVAEIAAPTESLATWTCIAVVLQLFYRVIRRETRFVKTLSDSSYSIYLFHHAIMAALVLFLLPYSLGALPKFLLVSAITLCGCGGAPYSPREEQPGAAAPVQRPMDASPGPAGPGSPAIARPA